MIADLKPYPAMKDSGVPWLGEVPEHWDVLPNRAIFDEIKERDRPDADMLSVTINKGVIRQQALLEDSSKKDSSKLDRSAYKFVRPGDIAYNKMRAWQGAVGVSEYEGIISPAYVVQRPCEGVAPRYVHYLLRTPAFAKEAERWSYGITSDMWSLRPEHFKLIYSCLPPLPEQSAIVRYLDHVDRRVRRLVRAKRKLIALLTEQKQAIIHRAVTRGLPSTGSGQATTNVPPQGLRRGVAGGGAGTLGGGEIGQSVLQATERFVDITKDQQREVAPDSGRFLNLAIDGFRRTTTSPQGRADPGDAGRPEGLGRGRMHWVDDRCRLPMGA